MKASPRNGTDGHTIDREAPRKDSPEKVTGKRLEQLARSQAFRCYYTGWKLSPETAGVDHIQPIVKGGEHVMSNVVVVHRQVNAAKGQMSESEFLDMCQAVVNHRAQQNTTT